MEQQNISLPEYLNELRKRADLTFKQIEAEVGPAHTTFSRYESGDTKKVPPQYLAYLTRVIHRQKSKRGRRGAAGDPALLAELNRALAHFYGEEEQFETWGAMSASVDAWIAAMRGTLGATAPQQLRAFTPDFVGRAGEIAQLAAALRSADEGALVTICGIRAMGGMGKTELAYRVAQEVAGAYPDAQLLLELRGSSAKPVTPEQALQTVIYALAPGADAPTTLPALQARYRSLLTGRRALILADDARDAAQVRALLPPPGSAVIVTSRRRFLVEGMGAAQVVELGGLREDEATALLLSICPRIGAVAPRLAERCAYLPLALRIAAARLVNDATLSPERYLRQLDDEHERLAGLEDPDDPTHSVAATIGLSYAALDAEAQAVFAQLSVFPASFTRAAATAVVDGAAPGALDTTLSLLHRLCLLDYDPARERFDQHDLLRCYGLAQLADVDAVRERHGSYAIGMVAQAAAQLQQSGDAALAGLDLFDAERAHIDASWRWAADGKQGERSDQLLLAFLEAIGYLHVVRFVGQRDFVAVLEATRAAAVREGRRDLEQVALTDLGWAYTYLDQPEAAVAAYTEARAIARERADLGGEVLILTNLANISHGASNATGALVHAEVAVTLARRADQPQMLVQALLTRGWILVTLRQLNVAHVAYREARSVARALGDARLEAHVLMQLGDATLGIGDRGQATHHSRAALRIAERIGDWHTRIYATKTLGDIAYVSRAPRDAIGQYEQALATSRAVGEAVSEATLLRDLGDAYHALHDLDRAAASYEAAAVVCEGLGDERGRAVNCWNQGRVLVEQGEVAHGVALMQERVDLELRLGHPDAAKHAAEIAQVLAKGGAEST